jgi:hypothetical protein
MSALLHDVAALLLYPGALALLAVGAVAEWAAAWALLPEQSGPVIAARSLLASLRPRPEALRPRTLPPLSGSAALLALLASTQVAAPFNPLPAADRNLLVATLALAGTAWLTWTWGWHRAAADPRLMLAVQLSWLVALLGPAIVPENLRPQALGAVAVPGLLPLKLAAGLLYLLCLPALVQLLPEAAPQGLPGAAAEERGLEQAGFGVLRVLLWLPYCGLFASLYFPPASDDPLGLLRFALLTWGAAAIAISVAANLARRDAAAARRAYLRVMAPFGVLTLLLALATAFLGSHNI